MDHGRKLRVLVSNGGINYKLNLHTRITLQQFFQEVISRCNLKSDFHLEYWDDDFNINVLVLVSNGGINYKLNLHTRITLQQFFQEVISRCNLKSDFHLEYWDDDFNINVKLDNIEDVKDLSRFKVVEHIDVCSSLSPESNNAAILDERKSDNEDDYIPLPNSLSDSLTSTTNVWHLAYQLPEFPENLHRMMTNNERLASSHKAEIITILYEHIAPLCNFYPKNSQYDHVIGLLLKTYPKLGESSPVDISMRVWKKKLQYKFKNRRARDGQNNLHVLSRKLKKDSDVSGDNDDAPPSKRRVPNYVPDYEPDESEETTEHYKLLLIKAKHEHISDSANVGYYMAKTFPQRRRNIVLEQKNVTEIVSEYPWLLDKTQVMDEFQRILGAKLDVSCMKGCLCSDYDAFHFLMKQVRKRSSEEEVTIKDEAIKEEMNEDQEGLKAEIALSYLTKLLKENVRDVIVHPEDSPCERQAIYIMRESDVFSVSVQGIIIPNLSNVMEALYIYLSCFHVFNLPCQKRTQKTEVFMLRKYFHLCDNLPVNSSVLSFITKLNEYNNTI